MMFSTMFILIVFAFTFLKIKSEVLLMILTSIYTIATFIWIILRNHVN